MTYSNLNELHCTFQKNELRHNYSFKIPVFRKRMDLTNGFSVAIVQSEGGHDINLNFISLKFTT